MTKAEFPRISPAKLSLEGCLTLRDIEPNLNAEEAAKAEVVLIGNIVELLCTFLGETLALRLIQDVWPNASFNESDPGKEMKA